MRARARRGDSCLQAFPCPRDGSLHDALTLWIEGEGDDAGAGGGSTFGRLRELGEQSVRVEIDQCERLLERACVLGQKLHQLVGRHERRELCQELGPQRGHVLALEPVSVASSTSAVASSQGQRKQVASS